MEQDKEFLTVGELGRRMNVSVRTLQYYDREGLLHPSAISEGGRRLYTYRDMVTLHQILSLKHLGFSLAQIRERLLPLEKPQEVAEVLAAQADALREQIRSLQDTLANIEKLGREVLSMDKVDFRCYADIVVNLEMNNNLYWAFKYFDPETRNQIRARFDPESGTVFLEKFVGIQEKAARLKRDGFLPGSPEGQEIAARFWQLVQEFTQGDPELLSKLLSLHEDSEFADMWQQQEATDFVETALGIYLERTGAAAGEGETHD